MKPGARTFVLAFGAVGAAIGGLWLGQVLACVLSRGPTFSDAGAFALCAALVCALGRQVLAAGGRPALIAFSSGAASWALLLVATSFGPWPL